jgi:hypothetical protein
VHHMLAKAMEDTIATFSETHPVELDVAKGRRRLSTCATRTAAGEEIRGADAGKVNDLLGHPGVALVQDLDCQEPVVLHTAHWHVVADKRSGAAALASCWSACPLLCPCDSCALVRRCLAACICSPLAACCPLVVLGSSNHVCGGHRGKDAPC